MSNPDQPYIDWILSALVARRPDGVRLTRRGIARALGVSEPVVTRLLDGTRQLKHWEIPKIAAYIGVPPPYIDGVHSVTTSLANVAVPVKLVPVAGECAGGRWMEYEVGERRFDTVYAVPTKFGALTQTAYRMRGNSLEKRKIMDGDYVITVPYDEARRGVPVDDDVVVVERRRSGLIERTCKVVRIGMDGRASLITQAADPRADEPVLRLDEQQDGVDIQIKGLVVGKYSPV